MKLWVQMSARCVIKVVLLVGLIFKKIFLILVSLDYQLAIISRLRRTYSGSRGYPRYI